MKLGLMVEPTTIERLVARARTAEAAGVEIVWFPPDRDTALICAAAAAAQTSVIRLAACVRLGAHPLAIAEAAAVADNCSNGRLILVLEDGGGDIELQCESVDAISAALSPRPFRHEGARWRIPANLPGNDQHEAQIVVTPQVVQAELPVWLAGPSAAEVARPRALTHVAGERLGCEDARTVWEHTEASLGLAAKRLRRVRVRSVAADDNGRFDVPVLVAQLRAEQRMWGLDTAVLSLPAWLDERAWEHAATQIAVQVRPRVTMHELPAGLDRYWTGALM